MMAIAVVGLTALGRCIYCLPALIGFALMFLALTDFSGSGSQLFLYLICIAGFPLSGVLALSLVSRLLTEKKIPCSWLACVSVGCLLLASKVVVPQTLESVAAFGDIERQQLAILVVRLLNTVVYVGAALAVLFCSVLVLIELPFVWGLRAAGIVTPAIPAMFRPAIVFLAITATLDLISAFLLKEWPIPLLLVVT